MTRNKKIIILGIGILIILFVLVSTTDLKYSLCSDHYTIDCWQESGTQEPNPIIKEHIPCFSDKDCSFEKMKDFCSPGYPSLLKCVGARYYCGNDGYCKGCICPWYSPAHWLTAKKSTQNSSEEEGEERLAESSVVAFRTVVAFMKARIQRDQEFALSWLTDNAKQQYAQPGLTLIGTSNPHFSDFEILEKEELGNNKFKFKVRIYEEYTGQGRVGYFDETLTVIKRERNKHLIDSVERSEYTNL